MKISIVIFFSLLSIYPYIVRLRYTEAQRDEGFEESKPLPNVEACKKHPRGQIKCMCKSTKGRSEGDDVACYLIVLQ